jgi:tetratricopeptide (TPR) repeat protein
LNDIHVKPFHWIIIAILFGTSLAACSLHAAAPVKPASAGGTVDTAAAYLLRGDQETESKAYDQAIADYTQAIQLKPNNAEAYNNRGLAYALKSKSQMESAIADYSQAIRLRPAYAYAYNNRGVAYMASGRPEQALSDFNRAIQLNPGFPQAHSNRGNYYWRSRQYGLAVLDLLQANLALVGGIALVCGLVGMALFLILRAKAYH